MPTLVSHRSVDLGRRGFPGADSPHRRALEECARRFLDGLNATWWRDPSEVDLSDVPPEHRGFVWEGMAMRGGLSALVRPASGARRWQDLMDAGGDQYVHLVHTGWGWGAALMGIPIRVPAGQGQFPALEHDGRAFATTFFRGPRAARRELVGTGVVDRAGRSGVGRALWFVHGARPEHVRDTVTDLASGRDAVAEDLWAGVGLAAAYTGAGDPSELARVVEALPPAEAAAAGQGVSFAVAARRLANEGAAPAEALARHLGWDPDFLALLVDKFAPNDSDIARYQFWRDQIRAELGGASA